ncbi:MAG TPA: hypothetical protein VE669_01430 [Actinomycetota bacterium]|jgi:hypothetical protein|nr:hypothetical protein [Actinomycetota bacterium]
MPEARSTITEFPPPPREPAGPGSRELRVPEVPAPEDADRGTLTERLDEIATSLRQIKELLEKVLRAVQGRA